MHHGTLTKGDPVDHALRTRGGLPYHGQPEVGIPNIMLTSRGGVQRNMAVSYRISQHTYRTLHHCCINDTFESHGANFK